MRARCRGQSRGRPSSRLGGGKSVRAERSGRRPWSRSAMSRDGRLRSRPFDSGLRPALRANGGGKTVVGNPFALSAAAAGRGVEASCREMVVCDPGPSTPAFGLRSGRTVVGNLLVLRANGGGKSVPSACAQGERWWENGGGKS